MHLLMVPMVNWWMRKDSGSENHLLFHDAWKHCLPMKELIRLAMPCNEESPYYKNMERIGYEPLPAT